MIPNNHGVGWMVRDWNERAGRTVTVSLTAELVEEEVEELREACESGDRAAIAKEACDVVWTAIDVLDAHGIEFHAAFTEVYRSNLTKIGPGGEVERLPSGKIAKGPFYEPPRLHALVGRRAGARGPRTRSERELRAENQRLRDEIAELRDEARRATLRSLTRRRVLPAGWVAARCAYILGTPRSGGWRSTP